ncbi:POTRA domain-containing protein [Thalassomonas actiniarum]|uniref:TamA POTRA domain-containing protein n=1 Tax=Thalassomonas actiniarum TaxID=485447 RepID=A0AAE9YW66_9GAMM|nr:POTRA domain-containing protein [Thalassomonas actiniarum]WDE02396.1 hypothetical protein SG35_028710 [Thalassomonas actiniarum]
MVIQRIFGPEELTEEKSRAPGEPLPVKPGIQYVVLFFSWFFCCLCPVSAVLGDEMQDTGTAIKIIGVDGTIKANIQSHLALTDDLFPLSVLGFPRSDAFIIDKTRQALQTLGYYRPEIRVTDQKQGKVLTVEPGQPVRWRNIDLRLTCEQAYPELQQLLNRPPFKSGDIVHHGDYENFKSVVHRQAFEIGLLASAFAVSQLNVDTVQSYADIIRQFNCGQAYIINNDYLYRHGTVPSAAYGLYLSPPDSFTSSIRLSPANRP